MQAVFVELPAFERHRQHYLNDDAFRQLQDTLIANSEAGDVIEGTGGLRKLRFGDARRGKGKRSGLRVIHYYWRDGSQFWLFTLYDKDEISDLKPKQRAQFKELLKAELLQRRNES